MSTTEKTKEIIPEITLPPEAKEIITDVKTFGRVW